MSIHNLETFRHQHQLVQYNQPNNLINLDEFRKPLPDHINDYQIVGVKRRSIMTPEHTDTGALIYQDLCNFTDTNDHNVVRVATFGIPNPETTEVSPYTVIATDPWITGPRGLNRIKIKQLVDQGFPVIWLHHADERSPIQRDKSVTRSARQAHALLDSLGQFFEFDLNNVIVDGYSRGGMTGEKFIALAEQHGRETLFSILDAPCFAVDMSQIEKTQAMLEQLPKEICGIGRVGVSYLVNGIKEGDLSDFKELTKTFNPHIKNIIHEIMWATALVNAQVGPIIQHQPEDTAGVRNFFRSDKISQMKSYLPLYEPKNKIIVVPHSGPHVRGADIGYLKNDRRLQFDSLHDAIIAHPDAPQQIAKLALQNIASNYNLAA